MICAAVIVFVIGNSLAPVVPDRTRLEAQPIECAASVQRGDLLYFHSGARDIPIIKRVVGMPGDRFAADDKGKLFINRREAKNSLGQIYRFNAARQKMLALYERSFGGVVPSDAYILLGEDPSGTTDSSAFGLVSRKDVIGKITKVVENSRR